MDGVKFKHFNNGVKVFEKNEKVGLLVIVLEGNVINVENNDDELFFRGRKRR